MALLQLRSTVASGPASAAAGAAGTGSTTTAAAETSGTSPQGWIVGVAFAGVLVGLVVAAAINNRLDPPAVAVAAGTTLFGAFYLVAQAIERLLEPLSAVLLSTKGTVAARNTTLAAAEQEVGDQRQVKLGQAAKAQAELDQIRANRAVVFWAIATVLAMLVSAVLGLYLVQAVGLAQAGWSHGAFSGNGWRRVLDILVTGLAIGGGTKPLHDLIGNLQASKDGKKDPPQVMSS